MSYRMPEDPNRTDPPEEFDPFGRFLSRLYEPENRAEPFKDRPENYLPITESELLAAQKDARERDRLLDIELAKIKKRYDTGKYRPK